MSAYEKVVDTILGRWKSQILYAGVKLGIFEALGDKPRSSSEVAGELSIDPALSYRLMRALATLGFLGEQEGRQFSLTELGSMVRSDHPQSLRGIILLEEGPEHYAIWKHLPAMVGDGRQDGFVREYGRRIFDYIAENPDYREIFNSAMSSYSAMHTKLVLDALKGYDFSRIGSVCDVGGGHGHLLCNLLVQHPQLRGIVLELESTIKDRSLLWAEKMGLSDRCTYLAGDMFREVPRADAYIMKMILHDWSDDECVRILSNIARAAKPRSPVFIVEHIIPAPTVAHFSKLFDIHMMCALTGRERTEGEYAGLLRDSGLKYVKTHYPASGPIGVIEGAKP